MTVTAKSRGWQRMKELAAEFEAERKTVEAELLASLGRLPSALDRLAAESISAAVVRSRRLRALGRDDSEQRRQITQLMRASGFKPDRPAQKPAPTIADQLAARRAQATTEPAR